MLSEHVMNSWQERVIKDFSSKPRFFKLSPSRLASCDRLEWAYAHGKVDKVDVPSAEQIQRMEDGIHHEDAFIETLRNTPGVEIISTGEKIYWAGMTNKLDARIRFRGVAYKVEFKSMSTDGFSLLMRHRLSAFPQYEAQSQSYLAADNDKMIFYAKNVGDGRHFDFIVEPNHDLIHAIRTRGEAYKAMITSEEAPVQPYDVTSPQCSGCVGRRWCWFNNIREGSVLKDPISEVELGRIKKLIDPIVSNYENMVLYDEAYENLKTYLTVLHSKHKVKKIKIKDLVSSSLILGEKEHMDKKYVLSVLEPEEVTRAFWKEDSTYVRMNLNWSKLGVNEIEVKGFGESEQILDSRD